MNARDRDGEGRARSARPRDGLGRPLPYGAHGVERQPEGVLRSPGESVAEAQRLLDAGMPFHAHEVFEDAWKSGPEAEPALWRGLAQLAVGLTHAARGNVVGGARLLRRGAAPWPERAGAGGAAAGTGPAYGMDLRRARPLGAGAGGAGGGRRGRRRGGRGAAPDGRARPRLTAASTSDPAGAGPAQTDRCAGFRACEGGPGPTAVTSAGHRPAGAYAGWRRSQRLP